MEALRINLREGSWITFWALIGLISPIIAADKVYAHRMRRQRDLYDLDQAEATNFI